MHVTPVDKVFSCDHSWCICMFIVEAGNLMNAVLVQKAPNRDLIVHQRTP